MTTQTQERAQDWAGRFGERMSRVRASEIRELLKLLDQPDILSFAGGIPDPGLFPARADPEAGYDAILADPVLSRQALQYSVSEGYLPLRQWIAERMTRDGMPCEPAQHHADRRLPAGAGPDRQVVRQSKGDTVDGGSTDLSGRVAGFQRL